MRIVTFNVNSVRARLEILQRWITNNNPDFLFLQETKTQDEFFPELFFDELGYKCYFHGEKSYNGVAAIVKKSLTENINVNFGFNDNNNENNFETRVLNLHFNDLYILNTYVPQGKSITHSDFDVKKKFFARVRNIIEANLNKKFLWLGDLNVAPENIDVTHPENKKDHVCFCNEIREVFAETKKSLIDLLRLFNKNNCVYTFYDYRVKNALQRNIGWRIDHMLATQKFANFVENCFADSQPRSWDKPSDHVPVILDTKNFAG